MKNTRLLKLKRILTRMALVAPFIAVFGGATVRAQTAGTPLPVAGGPACVVEAYPIASHGQAVPPRDPTSHGCYSTLADAIYAATGGRVQLPQTATPNDVTNAVLYPPTGSTTPSGITPNTTAVMGINWDGQGRTGQSTIWNETQEGTPCQTYSYGQPNLWNVGGSNWNDRIRSAVAYGNCLHVTGYNEQVW